MRVARPPDQRVRVQQRGVADGNAAQVVAVRLGAEVRVRLLDPQPERRGHRVEVVGVLLLATPALLPRRLLPRDGEAGPAPVAAGSLTR